MSKDIRPIKSTKALWLSLEDDDEEEEEEEDDEDNEELDEEEEDGRGTLTPAASDRQRSTSSALCSSVQIDVSQPLPSDGRE